MDKSPARSAYASEVRFGVVMYGGVSLAIYINGVANELYEMCCATPKADGAALPPPAGEPPPSRTRDVYRKLSWLLHSPDLRERYTRFLDGQVDDPFAGGSDPVDPELRDERTRFVVDVVAGTSAGGINGIFLAKALANGEQFAPLKKMWVQEGDIAKLLNDDKSWQGIGFAKRNGAPQSLLNSDRMYLKLVEAMQAMTDGKPEMPALAGGESALSDELDLYVTTTDILGAVVPLRLFDKVVYERRHKQVYHFQYAGADGEMLRNDFVADNNPFLSFSARCTSSFPFAFEPMQVADAQRLNTARPGGSAVDFGRWKSFFTGFSEKDLSSGRWRTRAFGDGGYLDNKPFSYVVEALSWRLASVPMDRKLIYVEPAPAHPERDDADSDAKPDAIENAVAALTHIPQYETIREDLQAVLHRNRRIERVERIVRRVEMDVELADEEPFSRVLLKEGKVPDWRSLDLSDMIHYYGVAFLPYRRLRLTTVSDDLADRLADRWGVDRKGDRQYAMRAVVRAWREENYYEHKKDASPKRQVSINAFLDEFDIRYRVRRAGFLLRKTHQLVRIVAWLSLPDDGKRRKMTDIESSLYARLQQRVPDLDRLARPEMRAALMTLRQHLANALSRLRKQAWPPVAEASSRGTAEQRKLLDTVLQILLGEGDTPAKVMLPGAAGGEVPFEQRLLPPIDPLRTLQENVYRRAQGLFVAVNAGRPTQLHQALEADIVDVRNDYTQAPGAGRDEPLLVRELLGNPKLMVAAGVSQQQDIAVVLEPLRDDRVAATLNTPAGQALRSFLAEYYLRFDEYDQVSFPLYYDTGTGEPSTVEVVRVSPEDAPSLIDESREDRRKLAGTQLFNFGGFLDAQWRRNDIMWGRLDGCERLLATLLPDDNRLRRVLLEEAQRAILREEMSAKAHDELVARFAQALVAQGKPTLEQAFGSVWQQLGPDDEQRGKRTAMALQAVLGDAGLLAHVQQHYEVNRQLAPEPALKTASRAITITGQVLEDIEKRHQRKKSNAVWIARGGRAFQALLAVATPGSLGSKVWSHWLALLYLFEALVFAGAVLLSEPLVRNFALAAFALTLSLHAATLVSGDLMRRRFGWLRLIAGVAVLAAVALAGLGGIGLASVGAKVLLCGAQAPAQPRSGLPKWICGAAESSASTSQTAASGRGSS